MATQSFPLTFRPRAVRSSQFGERGGGVLRVDRFGMSLVSVTVSATAVRVRQPPGDQCFETSRVAPASPREGLSAAIGPGRPPWLGTGLDRMPGTETGRWSLYFVDNNAVC
jgi:hypothetical protein